MRHLFVKDAYQPEELNVLHSLFVEITSQPSFDQDPVTKEAFAKHLVETFPATFDMRKHRPLIEASARMFYSREHTGA